MTCTDIAQNIANTESFVKLVLEDSIKGYLKYCQYKNLAPFANNETNRNCRMAWYN